MSEFLRDWLVQQGYSIAVVELLITLGQIVLVMVFAVLADVVAKRVVVRGLERLVGRTETRWDDIIVKRRLLHLFRISRLRL